MTINNEYDLGQIVYLRTDPEQVERMVTGIVVRPYGHGYYVTCGTEESTHYEFELSEERDTMKVLNISVSEE